MTQRFACVRPKRSNPPSEADSNSATAQAIEYNRSSFLDSRLACPFMKSPALIVASQYPTVAVGIRDFLGLFMPSDKLPHQVRAEVFSCSAELFEFLDNFDPQQLCDSIVLLHFGPDFSGTWQVKDMWLDHGTAAQLFLSYPEVYFVFVGESERAAPLWSGDAAKYHFVSLDKLSDVVTMVYLHGYGFRTHFDPTGARAELKHQLLAQSQVGEGRVYVPFSQSRTEHLAVIADEENAFVYLNGLVAYKAGFRCWLLSTESEFRRVLFGDRRCGPSLIAPSNVELVVADWNLAYPDHQGELPTDSLILEVTFSAEQQLLLITSYVEAAQDALWRRVRGRAFLKPYPGLFHLISTADDRRDNVVSERHAAVWLEVRAQGTEVKASIFSTGFPPHSAPYSRAVIASRLLQRARKLSDASPTEAESAVQQALLAMEAKELLGGLSRTTFLEALALQNEAEVRAEVCFFGMSAQIDARARLDMLENETLLAISRTTDRNETLSRMNCLLRVAGSLRASYARQEQIRAAEECLHRFTRYQRFLVQASTSFSVACVASMKRFLNRLVADFARRFPKDEELPRNQERLKHLTRFQNWLEGRNRKSRFRVSGWLRTRPSWYLDAATRSGTSLLRLLAWNIGICFVFSFAYFGLLMSLPLRQGAPLQIFGHAIGHSALTFVEMQPGLSSIDGKLAASDWLVAYRIGTFLEIVMAYVQLGILLAMLYRKITRHAP
jgi:hypothetical protein